MPYESIRARQSQVTCQFTQRVSVVQCEDKQFACSFILETANNLKKRRQSSLFQHSKKQCRQRVSGNDTLKSLKSVWKEDNGDNGSAICRKSLGALAVQLWRPQPAGGRKHRNGQSVWSNAPGPGRRPLNTQGSLRKDDNLQRTWPVVLFNSRPHAAIRNWGSGFPCLQTESASTGAR